MNFTVSNRGCVSLSRRQMHVSYGIVRNFDLTAIRMFRSDKHFFTTILSTIMFHYLKKKKTIIIGKKSKKLFNNVF